MKMRKKMGSVFLLGLFLLTIFSPSITSEMITSKSLSNDTSSNEKSYFNQETFIPGEFIVKFKRNIKINVLKNLDNILTTGIASVDNINRKYGVLSAEKLVGSCHDSSLSNIYRFTAPGSDIQSIVKEYNLDPNVEYAQPNYIYHLCVVPNDPFFREQWALHQSNDHDIDAPEAWDIETGRAEVIIAIVDSGIDYSHPDLTDNVWINTDEIANNEIDDDGNGFIDDTLGWDFWDDDNDPMDTDGHGTYCAGIAAAVTNNGIGIAGVSWNCKLMAIRTSLNDWDISGGIIYAVNNDADVINMAWGGYETSNLLSEVLNYAYSKGVALVAAAGNENTKKFSYPAAYLPVIAVAATTEHDMRASFSNYGSWIDVAAPGTNIISTYIGQVYKKASGTSSSASLVTGVVGLLFSRKPDITPKKVRDIIRSTADTIKTDKDIAGRLNAYEAAQALKRSLVRVPLNKTKNEGEADPITETVYDTYYSWPMIHHDPRHTGYTEGVGVIMKPQEKWVFSTKECIRSTPAIADVDNDCLMEVIVTSDDGAIYCLDGYTGDKEWMYKTGGCIYSSPAVGDVDQDGKNEVVFGSWDEYVYCLNGDTGEKEWKFFTQLDIWSSPAIADVDTDGKLEPVICSWYEVFCLDGRLGLPKWKFVCDETKNPSEHCIYSSPAVGDVDQDGKNEVVFGTYFGVFCIDGDTGEYIWYHRTKGRPDSPHAIGDVDQDGENEIIVTTSKWYGGFGKVFCLDGNTGREEWVFSHEASRVFINDASLCDVDNDGIIEILVSTDDKKTWCLDGASGTVEWCNSQYGSFSDIALGDIDSDGTIEVIMYDRGIRCLDALSGVEEWHHPTASSFSSPVLGDVDNDGKIEIVFCLKDGTVLCLDETVTGNHAPTTPSRPVGETQGKPDVAYFYTTTCIDSENDKVKYYFDWDDGTGSWTEYYTSDEAVSCSHVWKNSGEYYVRVFAQDQHGFRSRWSDPISVNIPRVKSQSFMKTPLLNLLNKVISYFPLFEKLFFQIENIKEVNR